MFRHLNLVVCAALCLGLMVTTSPKAQSLSASGLGTEDVEISSTDAMQAGVDRQALAGHDSAAAQPFGSNLFNGGFSNDREDGLNPNYQISPGDRISVRIWGATEFNDDVEVDPQGNIFLPSVGPISIAGTRNRDLNDRVSSAVGTVFTDNVRVYTSLNGSQPVAVFVTGFVRSPGRFAGIPSNSPLHFIDRAGGIDAARGSYRNIAILRGGETIARIDLYDFILDGKLAALQFRDGDTIVVGARGHTVTADGNIKNPARFEMPADVMQGAELIKAALVNPDTTHVGVSGTRDGEVFSNYLSLDVFADTVLHDGDQLLFKADTRENVIVVEIEGAHIGPSRFAVPANTRLLEILDYIEVDPGLADLQAISLKRKSIASRQKSALEDSLRRLEAKYLTASSQTDKESAIRANEAKLISEFVARARQVEPNGRLVVASGRSTADILLQTGDTIQIPKRSDSVLLSGEVLVSQALLHKPGLGARHYISRSGGFTQQADTTRILLVHPNGEVTAGDNPVVAAGDEIIVLPKVPVKNLQIASTIVDIIYKIAVAASVAVNL